MLPSEHTITLDRADSVVKSGYAPVNGLMMYYQIRGVGNPLIILHGGLGSTEMFGAELPQLARHHQVIAVDLQGHGRTADIDRPLRFESMADDIAELMKYLGLHKADVTGYSLGGGVALQTIIRHPGLAKKLVVVSAPFSRDGWLDEHRTGMARMGTVVEEMKKTPIYESYARIAPRPEDFSVLLKKLSELLTREYDWSIDVTKIAIPVLLAYGDADGVRLDHVVKFFALLGGGLKDGGWDGSGRPISRLAILPGLTHYTIFSDPAFTATAERFLLSDE